MRLDLLMYIRVLRVLVSCGLYGNAHSCTTQNGNRMTMQNVAEVHVLLHAAMRPFSQLTLGNKPLFVVLPHVSRPRVSPGQ